MAGSEPAPSDVAHVLDFFYQSFRDDIALVTGRDLANSKVSSTRTTDVRDLNGTALFRDYAIYSADGEKIGLVRSSAVGAQLPLIDAIMVGKLLYDERTVEATIMAKAKLDYPTSTFASKGFVCYGYPRVGIKLTVSGAAPPFDVIYDAHTAIRIREIHPKAEAGLVPTEAGMAPGVEGEPFYSYSARLPEGAAEDSFEPQWSQALHYMQLASGTRHRSLSRRPARDINKIVNFAAAAAVSPEDRKPAMRGITLPITLIGQQTPVYCAVAVGQMILDYIGVSGLTQADIAKAFHTGPLGTTNDDMIAGLKKLTAGRWSATLDTEPTSDKTAQYLAGFLPGKSGIYGHARLMRGFREYTYIDPNTGKPFLTTSFYLVNDPYPTNFGQYTMEAVNKPIPDFYRNLLSLVPPTS